jgi:hypothetical protein
MNVEENKAILVDGFVWRCYVTAVEVVGRVPLTSAELKSALNPDSFGLHWIMFIGVEKETEWSKANDVPVVMP